LINDNTIKGVFIRPCPKLFYESSAFQSKNGSVINSGELKTIVGGGTLRKVCEDLKNSQVTDIFLPFKIDDQSSAPECGAYGQLLYSSSEFKSRVSQIIINAKAAGFDPNNSIISICKQVYGDKILRFHAWFPLFQDPYLAQIKGVTGKLKFNLNENNLIKQSVDRLPMPFDVDYTSHLFAEPGNKEVRTQELAILKEIIRIYPGLYGINLDYVRYPEQESVVDVAKPGEPVQCIRDPRVEGIRNLNCKDIDNRYIAKRSVWNVNSNAVKEFVRMVKEAFPEKKLSANVFSTFGGRIGVGQDGIIQYLDITMPMAYTNFGANAPRISDVINELKNLHPNTQIVLDLRGWKIRQDGEGLITDLTQDIQSAKKGGTGGYVIFTYESFLNQTGSKTLESVKIRLGF
jgi:hypothetical protein